MLQDLLNAYADPIASIEFIILGISAIIHIIFAGAVAKDAGELVKQGYHPMLVSGIVWAFATLIGGVFVAAIYWFMHHSKLTRG